MAEYLRLPDNSLYPIKEGETEQEAYLNATREYPEAFEKKKPEAAPESGFIPALKAGFKGLQGDIAALAGRSGLMDLAAAEEYKRQKEAEAQKIFAPTQEGWTEAPLTKIAELAGGSLPYMAAPLAAGAAAATAPVSAPVATALGMGAAGLTSAAQFTGSNLSRQMEEGKSLGETDLGSAALASVPQAALDVVGFKMIPGIRRLFGAAGKELTEAQARQVVDKSLKSVIADYTLTTGKTMGAEGLTEAGQQVFERLQAGLSLTDEKARDEYLENFIGGAVLGGIMAPAGRFIERGGEQAKAQEFLNELEQKQAAERLAAEEKITADLELEAAGMGEAQTQPYYYEPQQTLPGFEAAPPQAEATVEEEPRDLNRELRLLQEQEVALQEAAKNTTDLDEKLKIGNQFLQIKEAQGKLQEEIGKKTKPKSPQEQLALLQKQMADAEQKGDIPAQVALVEKIRAINPEQTKIEAAQTEIPLEKFKGKSESADSFNQRVVGPEIAAGREAARIRRENIENELAKLRAMGRRAGDYEYDRLTRQQYQTEQELKAMEEAARMNTAVADQGELFGETGSKVYTGAEGVRSEGEIISDLRIARITRNNEETKNLIEELRAKRGEAEAPEGPQANMEVLQGKLPAATPAIEAQQAASDARHKAFADIVDIISKYNRGAAKPEQLEAARAALVNNLVKDIELTRGSPMEEAERKQVERDASRLIRELVNRFGDTRSLSSKGTKERPLFVPAQNEKGEFVTTPVPGMGFATVESAIPGMQTFGHQQAATMSIKEGIDELRNKAVGTTPTQTFERTFTPETTTPEIFRAELDKAFAKDPDSLTADQRKTIEQIADNLRVASADPEKRALFGEWLHKLNTQPATQATVKTRLEGRAPEYRAVLDALTRDVKSALSAMEAAKISETETLPSGETKTAVQEDLFAGEQEQKTRGTVFRTPYEFYKYLATDAVQQMRSDLGVVGPTLARLEKRIAPFLKQAEEAQAEADMYAEELKRLAALRKAQFDALKAMSAEDIEKETADIKAAKELVAETGKKLADITKRLDAELTGLQIEYMQARNAFEFSAQTSDDITAAIQANVAKFTAQETKALNALADAKADLNTYVKHAYAALTHPATAEKNAGKTFDEILEQPKTGLVFLQQNVVEATQNLQRMLALTNTDPRILAFLNKDIDLQMQLADEAAILDKASKNLLNAGMALEAAKKQQERSRKNKTEIKEAQQQIDAANTLLEEVQQSAAERAEAADKLEQELGFEKKSMSHRMSETTDSLTIRTGKLSEAEQALKDWLWPVAAKARELRNTANAALNAFIKRRDARLARPEVSPAEKQALANEQRRLENEQMARMEAIPGEVVSFEERRKWQTESAYSDIAIADFEASLKDAEKTRDLMLDAVDTLDTRLLDVNKRIYKLEQQTKTNPRTLKGKMDKQSRLVELEGLRGDRDVMMRKQQQAQANADALQKEIDKGDSALKRLREKNAEMMVMLSNDPEIFGDLYAKTQARLTKVAENIASKQEDINNTPRRHTNQLQSRKNDLSRYKREYKELKAMLEAKRGITRTAVGGEKTKPVSQPVVAGTRLKSRKIGPVVTNVRTGRKSQAGTARKLTPAQILKAAKEDVSLEQALLAQSQMEELLQTLETQYDAAEEAKDTAKVESLGKRINTVQRLVNALEKKTAKAANKKVGKDVDVYAGGEGDVATTYALANQTPANILTKNMILKGNFAGAVRQLVSGAQTALLRENAAKILPLLKDVKVEIVPGLTHNGESVPALYSPTTNTVMFDPNGITEENIIHEGTHAVTKGLWDAPESTLTESQRNAKREITRAYEEAAARSELKDQYGVKDAEEFMSELQSNERFRAAYSNRPWYTRAWRAILSFLGIKEQFLTADAVQKYIESLYTPAQARAEGRAVSAAPTTALGELSGKIIAKPKTFREKLGRNTALEAEMQLVDMRAGLREALKSGDNTLYQQAMYNVLKADQKMAMVYTVLSNGPLETYTDEKGLHGIRSTNKNNAGAVFEAISKLPVASPQERVNIATTYMLAQRALNKGVKRLDAGALGVTEAELQKVMREVDANPALKKALEAVRDKYNAFNKGLIDFLASSGAIPKKKANELLATGDYVPFYRVLEDGTAELVYGDNLVISVGDIRSQPYLNELKGGENRILPLNESLYQNALLLTNKALTNMATKATAYGLQSIGNVLDPATGKRKETMVIHKGKGPDDRNVIRFNQEPDPNDANDDGRRWIKVDTDGTVAADVPAALVVKSMEGAHLPLPAFLKAAGFFSDLLRSGVTRMPPYIFRQLIRDPMSAAFTSGLNYGPLRAVAKAGKAFVNISSGKRDTAATLIEKGLIQSNIFAGDESDISKIALQIASGKDTSALNKVFAFMDKAALNADAATRVLVYENAIKNGLSEVEADIMTMESMNFHKRGMNPLVQYGNRLIPFLNAQIQGLNVLVKAMRGNMPFEEQQKIKAKFYRNAMFLVATGIVYAMAMEDDDYFKNARPRDKYTNFFLHLPGVDEPLKIPTPFEAGYFFSLSVAAVDAMRAETVSKEQWDAVRDMFLSSIPGWSSRGLPQIIKPAFEVWTNKNFLSGAPIESLRMQNMDITERFNANTTEFAKQLSKALPLLSPIQIEHLARGYAGQLPLLVFAATNSMFAPETKGERPEKRTSEMPVVGTLFQKKYGGADSDFVYRKAQEAVEARTTFNRMRKEGRAQDAKDFMESHKDEIRMASAAGMYRNAAGRINLDMERVRNRNDMTASEKLARIEKLEKAKQDLADRFALRFNRVTNE